LGRAETAADRFIPLFCLEHTMIKKTQEANDDGKTAHHFSETVKDSAQQIWLAGLGAFSRAQEEGGKVFDALVKEGSSMQRKTQATAEEKMSEASSKMASMASDFQSRAGTQWDKLENIFEARVAKALTKLRVASADEVAALKAQVDALSKKIHRSSRPSSAQSDGGPAATPSEPPARRSAPRSYSGDE
jgi:poly(hydroxyalkanoate) granule-associated protein